MVDVKRAISSSGNAAKKVAGKAVEFGNKVRGKNVAEEETENLQEDLLVMDIPGLKKVDSEDYVDGGPMDDCFDVFQKTDLHIEKIPTMLSHTIVTDAENNKSDAITELVILSANHESSWSDALLALNDYKVQRVLSHRAALILAFLHPEDESGVVERYNMRDDVAIPIDGTDIKKFRHLRALLTQAFITSGINEVSRASHIAMIGLANNGDLRKIISCEVPTEPMVDVLDIAPSPIPDENAGMPKFKAQPIAELSSAENELIDEVANQYISDNKVF